MMALTRTDFLVEDSACIIHNKVHNDSWVTCLLQLRDGTLITGSPEDGTLKRWLIPKNIDNFDTNFKVDNEDRKVNKVGLQLLLV